MKTFTIHQVQITRELARKVNELGSHDAAARAFSQYKAHLDTSCFGAKRFTPDMLQHYTPVARVANAADLEEVFEIGNGYGDQKKLQELAPHHSLSVGDLVDDGTHFFICDPMGWTQVATINN